MPDQNQGKNDVPKICIAEVSPGDGGIAGGGGNGQGSLSATGTGVSAYGYPVIELVTGLTSSVEVQLTKNLAGNIQADFSNIGKVLFIARPTMHSTSRSIFMNCSFSDTAVVRLDFTPVELNYNQGLWYAEFLCYSKENPDVLLQTYRAYLVIRKGMTGSETGSLHPLTVFEVRLALMDTEPSANVLLEDLEFSDFQIVECMERAVREWNETPPSISTIYNGTNFPYHEYWLKGAVGYLLQMVAYRYTRNQMRHSNAGLSYDDNDKGPNYIALANQAISEFKAFVMAKKTELNMHECMGILENPFFVSSDFDRRFLDS